jgi:hypothetical protein
MPEYWVAILPSETADLLFIYLFIYGLCNDTISNFDFYAVKWQIINLK